MSLIIRANRTTFTPAPEGVHSSVCVDVVDKGEVPTSWGPKHKVQLRWELDKKNHDHDDKPFLVVKTYTLSLHERSSLYKDLLSWRGKSFSREELEQFDLEKLLGVNAQVQVIHQMGDDGTEYSIVQAVMPPNTQVPKLTKSPDYVRVVDRDQGERTAGTLAEKPENGVPF